MDFQPVLTLPRNTQGRDFVVGDIHGAYDLLRDCLKEADFDPSKDRLISVGDLIDRGPQSPGCLWFLQQPWFFAIRGNHEDIFLGLDLALEDETTMRRVNNDFIGLKWVTDQPRRTLEEIREMFTQLPLAMEVETATGIVGCVHADIPAGMDWETFKEKLNAYDPATTKTALWDIDRIKKKNSAGVKGIDRVFFGHFTVDDNPRQLGNCFYIDTGGVISLAPPKRTLRKHFMTVCDITADAPAITAKPPRTAKTHVVLKKGP